MTTVFIAGSISISRLHAKVQERISKIVSSDFEVVVGDADGADSSIQECLRRHHACKVTVYCSGDVPRNNLAQWPVHKVASRAKAGSRAYFTAKDLEMARKSDYGLMVWDCKSTGTLSNVIELLKESKKSSVFINKKNDFITVSDRTDLYKLLNFMSDHARAKAEEKIGLTKKIANIDQNQLFLTPVMHSHASPEQDSSPTVDTSPKESKVHIESLRLRSSVMSALKDHIRQAHMSQSQAARVFGVPLRSISDLTHGKIDLFGLDSLVSMALAAGMRVEMHVREAEPAAE